MAFITFANQIASSIADDIVEPWITTELNNDNVVHMRYGYYKTLFYITLYMMASWLDYIIFLFISLQRPDFMIIGIVSDVGCRMITTAIHIRHKTLLNNQKRDACQRLNY